MSKIKSPGFIYILTNKSMPGIVKIGRTKNNPKKRAQELSGASGVPTPFVVEWSHPVQEHEKCEKNIHTTLCRYRLNTGREFFKLPVNRCIGLVQHIISKYKLSDGSFVDDDDDSYPKMVNGKKIVKKPLKASSHKSKRKYGNWMGG